MPYKENNTVFYDEEDLEEFRRLGFLVPECQPLEDASLTAGGLTGEIIRLCAERPAPTHFPVRELTTQAQRQFDVAIAQRLASKINAVLPFVQASNE